MGLRKYLGSDRRRHSRYPAAVEVEFQVWDAAKQIPRTGRVRGQLTDISLAGACLQTNHTLIEGHHILLDNDPEGNAPLCIVLPASPEGGSWTITAHVLWYNSIEGERRYKFDVGLQFVNLSPSDRERLRGLLTSVSTA